MLDILEALFTQYGYAAVFVVLVACGFGIPIPEDITLIAGGVISGLGHSNAHIMVVVGMIGVLTGDGMMFLLGHFYGDRILKARFVKRLMPPQRYLQVQEKFDKHGSWVLFVARFLPGLRTPIFITAGMSGRISFWRWLIMDGLASLISVPAWVYLGHYGAANKDWLLMKAHQFQHILYVIIGIGALVLFYFWQRKRRRRQFFHAKLQEMRQERQAERSQRQNQSAE